MTPVLAVLSGLWLVVRALRLVMRWAGWRLEVVPLPGAVGGLVTFGRWVGRAVWLLSAGATGCTGATPWAALCGAAFLAGATIVILNWRAARTRPGGKGD